MADGLTVYGDKLLIAKIDKLIAMGSKRTQIRAAFNRASKPLRMTARNNAKRNKDSGTLWRSIKMINSRRNRSLFWIGPARGKKQTYDAWYALFVEKGTKMRKTKSGLRKSKKTGRVYGSFGSSGRSTGKIRGGYLFMQKAYTSQKGKVRLGIIRELNIMIKKIAG